MAPRLRSLKIEPGLQELLLNLTVFVTHLTQTRLLPFFSNLLTEGSLRDYLVKRAGVNPLSAPADAAALRPCGR